MFFVPYMLSAYTIVRNDHMNNECRWCRILSPTLSEINHR